jgi:hypothetical protein
MLSSSARPAWEVGDILRQQGPAYRQRHPLTVDQAKVLSRLATCRTARRGGHVDSCDTCGFARVSYNSCRDRHCPKCQARKRADWLETRMDRLLPVPYFHVVFTIPDIFNPLILHNQRRLYDLLFHTASATLLTLAADPQRLGAQVGITTLLHTWGQNLLFHPHLHCVVTGGGLSLDGQRWISGKPHFFLPVRVLGKLFRGKFLAGLKDAYHAGLLRLEGSVATLTDSRAFQNLLDAGYARNWNIYAKAPFGGVEQVFRYLGRYSHRVAISNHRLRDVTDTHVQFQWKDYARGNQVREMRLHVDEFIRRFLLHVLPKGFVRIRHYGLLASINVAGKLEQCRRLLEADCQPRPNRPTKTWIERVVEWTGREPMRCPRCQGPLTRRELSNPLDYGAAFTRAERSSREQQTVPAINSS